MMVVTCFMAPQILLGQFTRLTQGIEKAQRALKSI
jgi:hypothetical protein